MTKTKTIAALAAAATFALISTDLSASAQSSLTNGPNDARPNSLASDNATGLHGAKPSRGMIRRKALRSEGYGAHQARYGAERTSYGAQRTSYAYRRPLTVRRTVAAAERPIVVTTPVPVANTGPGTLVTGPLSFASNVVSLPFRGLNDIFPATGDVGANPLVLIGAPLRAIGDIVQLPFRVIGAPFGGTTVATY